METDHLCIGGGPAGVFAALTAAANGKRCMILEHNKQLGPVSYTHLRAHET